MNHANDSNDSATTLCPWCEGTGILHDGKSGLTVHCACCGGTGNILCRRSDAGAAMSNHAVGSMGSGAGLSRAAADPDDQLAC